MYYSTSGEEFGNEKATYLGYINVQCVHVHNSNNLIVISRSYLTYHDTNDSRGGGVGKRRRSWEEEEEEEEEKEEEEEEEEG